MNNFEKIDGKIKKFENDLTVYFKGIMGIFIIVIIIAAIIMAIFGDDDDGYPAPQKPQDWEQLQDGYFD